MLKITSEFKQDLKERQEVLVNYFELQQNSYAWQLTNTCFSIFRKTSPQLFYKVYIYIDELTPILYITQNLKKFTAL